MTAATSIPWVFRTHLRFTKPLATVRGLAVERHERRGTHFLPRDDERSQAVAAGGDDLLTTRARRSGLGGHLSEKHLPITTEAANAMLAAMSGRVVVARVEQVGSLAPEQPEVTGVLSDTSLRSWSGRTDEDAPRTLRASPSAPSRSR